MRVCSFRGANVHAWFHVSVLFSDRRSLFDSFGLLVMLARGIPNMLESPSVQPGFA